MKARTAFFVFLVSIFSISLHAQNQKLSRAEKKVLKEAQLDARKLEVAKLISDTTLVIEMTKVGRHFVNPTLYFLILHEDDVILQTGLMNETDVPKLNGVTMEGTWSQLEIEKKKKTQTTLISGNFNSSLGHYRVNLRVSSYGAVSGAITPLSKTLGMEFRGEVVPFERTGAYIGGPVY